MSAHRAKVDHRSNSDARKFLSGEKWWLLDRRKNIKSSPAGRIGHCGQVEERLDWPVPELLPNSFIFLLQLRIRWMQRPVDAGTVEVFKGRRNGAIALIQSAIEFRLQT